MNFFEYQFEKSTKSCCKKKYLALYSTFQFRIPPKIRKGRLLQYMNISAKRILAVILLSIVLPDLSATASIDQKHTSYSQPRSVQLEFDANIAGYVNQVSYDSIYSYLQQLESFGVKSVGSTELVNARDWIYNKYLQYGYTDIQFHDFNFSGNTLQNIILTKTGTRQPDVHLIIDGHYDTIVGPGVNDNGSGTAIILETARILADVNCNLTIRFINFSAEEVGLVGSQAYVTDVAVAQNEDILLVLNIDEVGGVAGLTNNTVTCERDEGPPPGNNPVSAAYTDTLSSLTQMYSSLNTQIAYAYASDYMPFEDAGFIITGFFETNESSYPHSPNDVLANLDPAYVTEIAKATVAAALHFAQLEAKYLDLYHTPITLVEDDINPTQVSVKVRSSSNVQKAELFYRINSGVFEVIQMPLDHQDGDTLFYSADIPAQSFGTVIDYYLHFTNQDSIDSRLPQNPGEYYTFTIAPDLEAPQILHAPIPDQSYLINPIRFSLEATDRNGLRSVSLFVDINGSGEQEIALQRGGGDKWFTDFETELFPADSVSYRFRAVDNSSNQNVAWEPESGTYSFELLNSELFTFEAGGENFTASGDWGWGHVTDSSIPGETGRGMWATAISGTYTADRLSQLSTTVIDLSGKQDISLVIDHFYSIEPINDGGNVKVSVNNGPFQVIAPETGYPAPLIWLLGEPGFTGNSYFFKQDKFDLNSFTGDSIRFRFDFRSDYFTNLRGWYINEIRMDFRGEVANHPPQVVSFYPAVLDSIAIGSEQEFSISGIDVDGDSVRYTFKHDQQTVYDSTAIFNFTRVGKDTVMAVLDDGRGRTAAHLWVFDVLDTVTAIARPNDLPEQFYLFPAYPNPFNPVTTILYRNDKLQKIQLAIYNIAGEKIKDLVNDIQTPGEYRVEFSGDGLASGLYLAVIRAGSVRMTRRLLLIK